jgi:glycosyltransferase involved in cell wall biosynthesis
LEDVTQKKVLVLGMVDSIHLARWLEMFVDSPYIFTIFSSSPNRKVNNKIKNLAKIQKGSKQFIYIHWISKYFSVPLWITDKILGNRIRPLIINYLITTLKPRFIHALEFQNAGYLILKASIKNSKNKDLKIIVSNYGSDIYWFQNKKRHQNRITDLLSICNGYIYECKRDLLLARKFGLNNVQTLLIPNSGGLSENSFFTPDFISQGGKRSSILIKGYHGKFGRSLYACLALTKIRKHLDNYKVVFYSTPFIIRCILFSCNLFLRTNFVSYGKKSLSHDGMLKLFRESIIYIGLSKSDGISTSCIEAMSQGCIPIQSNTSCANEWIIQNESGFLVNYDAYTEIANNIKFILLNSNFVFKAQKINYETIRHKYNLSLNSSLAIKFYDSF